MKAGVVAALIGSALANPGYWPDPVSSSSSSSTPAAPVKPSSTPCDDDEWSHGKTSSTSTKKSSTTSSAAWTGSWKDDGDFWPKPSSTTSSKKSSSSSSAAWDGKWVDPTWSQKAAAVSTTSSAGAKPTWVQPAYFDPQWACCKAVVTETVWVDSWETSTSSSKASSTPAKPVVLSSTSEVWSVPAQPTVPAKSSSAPADGYWSIPAQPTVPAKSSSAPADGYWSIPAQPVVPAKSSSAPADGYWSVPAKASSSVAAKPSASSSSTSGSGNIAPNGNKWAMTYTPYTTDGKCKSASQVDEDIQKIKSYGFTTVRLYATDCSGLENVGGSVKKHGLKIILGVFLDKTGVSAASKQVSDINAWGAAGNWGSVAMIVVGNESVFNGYCSASELAGLISSSKSTWAYSGYTGPVTTAETVDILQKYSSALCGVIDVAGANIQPFFTSSVEASWAGTFVQGQLSLVEAACPGKTAYNLECGWPSAGSSNGAAKPSKADQKAAISDIIAKVGDKSVIFSFEDDAWKDAGSFGVEKSFGCSDVFGSSSSY